jgi:hypothetical protein
MICRLLRYDIGTLFATIVRMKQRLRIKVSGDIEGDFVVIEARSEDEFLIARESSLPSPKDIRERSGTRPATAEEFATFEAENGPFLPPDGEG